jgi:DNA-binding transcriptional ArsR family regulator
MPRTKERSGQQGKSIEEVLSYAVGHRIRVQVLTVLSEGVYSPDEIARIIGEPTGRISHHIKEMLDAGSIELAKTRRVRNAVQHFYRAIEMPYYSDEDVAAMTPQQRQVTYGLVLQTILSEVMAAFWAGKLVDDPRVWLTSCWFNVDQRGREEIADEQERSWERIREIEAAAIDRCAESEVETFAVMVQQLGFLRERKGPVPAPGYRH